MRRKNALKSVELTTTLSGPGVFLFGCAPWSALRGVRFQTGVRATVIEILWFFFGRGHTWAKIRHLDPLFPDLGMLGRGACPSEASSFPGQAKTAKKKTPHRSFGSYRHLGLGVV